MSIAAKVYILATCLAGVTAICLGAYQWQSQDLSRFCAFLLVSTLTSMLKLSLPGLTSSLSANFLFVLIGILDLSYSETLAIGCAGTLVQCCWKSRPKTVHLLFNISSMATAIAAAYSLYHALLTHFLGAREVFLLGLAVSVFFLANTVPVAVVIALVEGKPARKTWRECYFWSFPYYLMGGALAGLVSASNRYLGWEIAVCILPVVYLVYRSYRLYLTRLEDEKTHAQEVAALHLRTIEALALAIDAKDATAYSHLRRLRVYTTEIGKELGLGELELEALQAAALLHDVGKLAVPEHILSKPGELTPEEFEKMTIHAAVGAEILERVQFPYPVVPIVRAHHERWDGSGYPRGLAGEEIPIGSRILSVVDCLDALCTPRPYRPAMPLGQAVREVTGKLASFFDPRVLAVLERRYAELEAMFESDLAKSGVPAATEDRTLPVVNLEHKGAGPAKNEKADSTDFLSSIAAARQEVQILFELTQNLGNSLSLDETLSVVSVRLKRIIPYDSVAIYLVCDGVLLPKYVWGVDVHCFFSLVIPLGEGLSGWVAKHQEPIVNGNPAAELHCLGESASSTRLQSGLAVPLHGLNGMLGVLALYRVEREAFSRDHLRIVQAVSPKLAHAVENALKFQQAETSATIDSLTNLPNARSMFLHLEGELARCKREGAPLALLVCDLDGFKQVNDRFGHLEGNRVLQLVGTGIKGVCRQYDCAARMGGDEFVLVLPGLRSDDLASIRERLAEVAAGAGLTVCGEPLLSVSIGEAFYPSDAEQAEQLLAIADQRMYQMKHQHHLLRPDRETAPA